MPALSALLRTAVAALAAAVVMMAISLVLVHPASADEPVHLTQAAADGSAQSESGTDGMNEDEPPAAQDDAAPEDGTRQGERNGDPGDFGGCIFQERPLELLV